MHAASFAYQCLQADAREHPCHPLIGPLGIFPRLVRRDDKLCFNSQTAEQAKAQQDFFLFSGAAAAQQQRHISRYAVFPQLLLRRGFPRREAADRGVKRHGKGHFSLLHAQQRRGAADEGASLEGYGGKKLFCARHSLLSIHRDAE